MSSPSTILLPQSKIIDTVKDAIPQDIRHPHPEIAEIGDSKRRYYLFGSPIAASASPSLHNFIFSQRKCQSVYSLVNIDDVHSTELYNLIRKDGAFGGASVTMPLKLDILKTERLIDSIDELAEKAGCVNTLVKLPTKSGQMGHIHALNTDILGIKCALLGRSQASSDPGTSSAFVVGAGATARSAVYALHSIGFRHIFVLNRSRRNVEELVAELQVNLKELKIVPICDGQGLEMSLEMLSKGEIGPLSMAVGTIPCSEPSQACESELEKNTQGMMASVSKNSQHPATFLDMCYFPNPQTRLIQMAKDASWNTIEGSEVMVEQGLAQARAWAGVKSVSSSTSVSDIAQRQGKESSLGEELESEARQHLKSLVMPK